MRSKYITFIKEANGRYLRISGSYKECFGVDPVKIINRTSYECYDYEVAREFEEGDTYAIASGQTDTRIINWPHCDGHTMLWMVKKISLKDDLILGVAFDITAYMRNHSSGDLLMPMNTAHTMMLESFLTCSSA